MLTTNSTQNKSIHSLIHSMYSHVFALPCCLHEMISHWLTELTRASNLLTLNITSQPPSPPAVPLLLHVRSATNYTQIYYSHCLCELKLLLPRCVRLIREQVKNLIIPIVLKPARQ